MDPLVELSKQTTTNQIHGLAYHMACAAYNFLYNSSLGSMYTFLDPPYIHMSSVPIFEIIIKEGWKPINPKVEKITVSASNFIRGNPRGPFVNALIDDKGNTINLIEQSTLEDIFDFLSALVVKEEEKEFVPPAKLEPLIPNGKIVGFLPLKNTYSEKKKKEKKERKKMEVIPGLWQ